MKKISRWIGGGLILLVGVLLFRTFTFTSRQVAVTAVDDQPLDEEVLLARFARSLTIPTVTTQDGVADSSALNAFHSFLRSSFPLVHEQLSGETVNELSLLYTWEGTDSQLDPIVLMGHMDIVPVSPGTEDNWVHPPFGGVIDNDFVWGRGALDDKLAVLAILESVEELIRVGFQPRRTVFLVFGHDEEVGGNQGAKVIAGLLRQRGIERLAMVLDEGGVITSGQIPGLSRPVAVVGVAEKGSVTLTLRVEGPGGHSSTPPGQTNIGILASAITRLEADPFPMRIGGAAQSLFDHAGPETSFGFRLIFANMWLFRPVVESIMAKSATSRAMLHTTTAATVISGGIKSNVLPGSATAEVNFRILPGETPQSVAQRVGRIIDDDRVDVLGASDGRPPSPISDTDGVEYAALSRTIREIAGTEVVVAPYLALPGTDARHFTSLSANVYRFLPTRFENEDMRRVHGTDERVATEDYLDSVRFFDRLIRNFDAL